MITRVVWDFNLQIKKLHLALIRGLNVLSINKLVKESNSLEIGSSRESKHSLCNGEAKHLQNAKGKLKSDQNIFSFLNTSFFYIDDSS